MNLARTMLLAATAVAAATAPALAQDARPQIDQIGGAARDASGPVQQISPRSPRTDESAPRQPRPAGPLPQLSSGAESAPSAPQLTSEGRVVRPPAQLHSGGRTAEPSEPLSRPSQGRTGAVARVEGDDRCDAAADRNRAEACARVIETRSAEFIRPDPTVLSPEQRLLVDQRLREAPATARSGARRLAATGADAESEETQSVASLVLRPPAQRRDEEPAQEQDATAAEAAAIVNAIINAGSSRSPN